MHVCLCRGISTKDIKEELDKRPSDATHNGSGVTPEFAEEIHRNCSGGQGYRCGSCKDEVKCVIDSHYDPEKVTARLRNQKTLLENA